MAKILIVEDEESVCAMLSQSLKQLKHEIFSASDGDQALECLTKNDIDLVITDIIMPNREGLETIQDIRQNWPEIKIVAMSGGGHVGNMNFLDLAEKFGAAGTLQKPFTIVQLRSVISEALDQSMWRDE